MLRFIIEQHEQDHNFGKELKNLYSVDIDCPVLENALRRGGSGPMGFEIHRLVGVEVLPLEDDQHA